MANRAYLYFTDDIEMLSFERHYKKADGRDRKFMDSRHQFPLAWFLFFHHLSVRAEIEPEKYRHDIYMVREWDAAEADFSLRVPMLLSWFTDKFTYDNVETFLAQVTSLQETPAEKYLVTDPYELEVEGESREREWREAMQLLENPHVKDEAKFNRLNLWAAIEEFEKPQRLHDCVFGIYYSGYFDV